MTCIVSEKCCWACCSHCSSQHHNPGRYRDNLVRPHHRSQSPLRQQQMDHNHVRHQGRPPHDDLVLPHHRSDSPLRQQQMDHNHVRHQGRPPHTRPINVSMEQ